MERNKKGKIMNAKEEILHNLKSSKKADIPERIDLPPPYEMALNKEQMIEKFTQKLVQQSGVVYHAKGQAEALEELGRILKEEKVQKALASDEVINALDLKFWGKSKGYELTSQHDYKEAVFTTVEAGITGADFGIAESGTLIILHDEYKPRLISLAPILHIVILPADRIVRVYEDVIDVVYSKETKPSQLTFITGPSMTADIQGVPFKGMHGPRRLIVILIEQYD
jgi:L-lactate dehydrogenase complex protein LldG